MRTLLTALLLTGSAFAAPLTITPPTQEVQPGALVILTASEWTTWAASAGTLGSIQGSRVVLEAPRSPGTVTVTVTDPKDATRRAFAVVTVAGPKSSATYHPPTFVAGHDFSAAVAQDGSTWVWGSNETNVNPTLGRDAQPLPIRVDGLPPMVGLTTRFGDLTGVDAQANAWHWGSNEAGPQVVASGVNGREAAGCVLSVRGGDLYLSSMPQAALRSASDFDANLNEDTLSLLVAAGVDGQVWYGRTYRCPDLTLIPMPEPMARVALSSQAGFVAISRTGAGYRYARNPGVVTPLAGFTDVLDVAIHETDGVLLKKDGRVAVFTVSNDVPTIPVLVPGLSDIVAISVSDTHVLALRRDGTLFAAGSNTNGQLGNGTRTDSGTFVEVVGLKVKLP
ncbi:hypothetical protein [Deinococcus daejeonensis]|uniref:Uncharacterized protein n=1 Tax=Deinococcus daejeonensis TaxID=1007098 RepID=A0ABQ2JFX2_9DEIO|nr:hypothetical protein [Deinococcus daejeonensis]GGN46747.1 hypothetical protein GCM10010842_37580 [Deinococcus daejeonensis]